MIIVYHLDTACIEKPMADVWAEQKAECVAACTASDCESVCDARDLENLPEEFEVKF